MKDIVKEDTKLTHEQKKRGKMTKNVDPTRAITEDEPCEFNRAGKKKKKERKKRKNADPRLVQVNQSKNHYRSLSQLKFKDRFGNDISTPKPCPLSPQKFKVKR